MTNLRIRIKAWRLGACDGFSEGATFHSGITWTEGPWLMAGANEAYDHGVNCGQILRTGRTHSA